MSVRNLVTEITSDRGQVTIVDDLSFDLGHNETLAIVGESGSGKSVTALSIMRLIGHSGGSIVEGKILFNRHDRQRVDLVSLPEDQMRRIRGNDISMIFQEPMTSLNPLLTVGDQISEAIILHRKMRRREAAEAAGKMLEKVGIPEPRRSLKHYPHQLSGGMRQRVMIAMALSCHPKILIADEPTTALDVTIQAEILDLLRELQEEVQMSVIYITHDLGVVAEIADRVLVMYAGRAVEEAETDDIFFDSRHPYTMGLLQSIVHNLDDEAGESETLNAISGIVPNPHELPPGCVFSPRCHFSQSPLCVAERPVFSDVGPGRRVRCARWREVTTL